MSASGHSGHLSGHRLYVYLRRIALALSWTPFHPQWYSFRVKELAARRVAGAATGNFLDVGCAGATLRSRVANSCRYLGLDYPTTGKELYGAKPDIFADAAHMPFSNDSFDSVCLLDVLEHLPEPENSLNEIARILRPGGFLYISVPFMYPIHDAPHDYQRMTVHGLRRWLDNSGLELVEISSFGRPVETAAMLFNVALARALAKSVSVFPPAVLLAVLVMPAVFVSNVISWALAWIGRDDDCMPFSYWLSARRAGGNESDGQK